MAIITPTFDAAGMRILTVDEVRANLQERTHTSGELGAGVSTGDHSYAGMMIDIMAPALSDLYELVYAVWIGWDEDGAEGVDLDNLEGLKGIDRDNATFSHVDELALTGVVGTPVPAGTRYGITADGPYFATDDDDEIGVLGILKIGATATVAGPTAAAIGAIETIVDGVFGVDSVTNLDAADPGSDIESDSEFRNRGEDASLGTTTEEAIYTRLVDRDDVEHAVVTSNRTGTTDADGTPGHTLWIVLYPDTADPQGVAETIWGEAGAPAGIGFRGDETATVTDANNIEQRIAWDWATEIEPWIDLALVVDATYPADGDDLVEAAVVAWGDTLRVGEDVYPGAVANAAFDSVPGIVSYIITMKVGSAPAPGDIAPIFTAVNEIAKVLLVNVEAASTPVVIP